MRRRQLLTNLAVTAAAAIGASSPDADPQSGEATVGEVLVGRVRDAMLGLSPQPGGATVETLRTGLTTALSDFHGCRYDRLSIELPRLITAGHQIAAEDEAATMAARLGGRILLRDHGGGFSPATVELHRISAEYSLGEPGAAITAAKRVPTASLPTIERRARYYTDLARAYDQAKRRDPCLRALLAAERCAPEEVHARPAIRDLITGLLLSGRTDPELRGLAARSGIR